MSLVMNTAEVLCITVGAAFGVTVAVVKELSGVASSPPDPLKGKRVMLRLGYRV